MSPVNRTRHPLASTLSVVGRRKFQLLQCAVIACSGSHVFDSHGYAVKGCRYGASKETLILADLSPLSMHSIDTSFQEV